MAASFTCSCSRRTFSGIGRKKSEALDVEAETQPRFQPALWRLSAMVFQLLKTGLQLKLPVRIVNFSRLQFVGALPHMERVCIAATFGRGAQIDSHGPPRIQCADDLRRCSKWLPMNIGLQSHVALTGPGSNRLYGDCQRWFSS